MPTASQTLAQFASGLTFEQIPPEAVARAKDGLIDTGTWITHRAPMDGMIEAFPGWLKPENGVLKAMVAV